MDAAPEPIERETTDPTAAPVIVTHDTPTEPILKTAADQVGWLKVIVLATISVATAAIMGYIVFEKVALKTDIAAAEARRANEPPDPRLVKRMDEATRYSKRK